MRKSALAVVGAAAAVAMAGCGQTTGGTPGFADAQALVRAVDEGTKAGETSNISMTMEMGPLAMSGTGQARYTADDYASAMKMDIEAQGQEMTMELRMLDQVVYLKLPENMPGAPQTDKPWQKGTLNDLAGFEGMNLEQMLDQGHPAKTLERLAGTGEIVSSEPGEEINGEATTKHTINVDFQKAMEQLGNQEALEAMLPSGMELDDMPVEVWLNDDDLPMQIKMDMGDFMKQVMEAAAEEAGQEIPASAESMFEDAGMTMKYFDWGTEVNIEAPPADEVGPFTMGG